MLTKANASTASLDDILEAFSSASIKYEMEYKKIPVLIIDNANRIVPEQLNVIQDYAKSATDYGIANIVFISSKGHLPRYMRGKLFLFIALFVG